MQFYLNGYKPGDPDVLDESAAAKNRSPELPDAVDALVVSALPPRHRDRAIAIDGASPKGAFRSRPDQYVANVFPLDAHEELGGFFAAFLVARR